MSDGTEYLPEQFRVAAGHQHEAADQADALARRVGRVTASAGQFGGAGAAGFATALDGTAAERARAAALAQEARDAIGEGATGAAAIGDETDALAAAAVGRVRLTGTARQIADGI
jgi:hypothetical protein